MPVNKEEYARRIEEIRGRLYKTAFLYMGSEALALDVLDEAVYQGMDKLLWNGRYEMALARC